MAFDESLADRIREVLARKKGIEESILFGCACFLLGGNVLVGVWKQSLIARVGPDEYEDALLEANTKEFDITGRATAAPSLVSRMAVARPMPEAAPVTRATLFATRPIGVSEDHLSLWPTKTG